MTPKELQEQYLAELKPKLKEVKVCMILPDRYISNVRKQVATLIR